MHNLGNRQIWPGITISKANRNMWQCICMRIWYWKRPFFYVFFFRSSLILLIWIIQTVHFLFLYWSVRLHPVLLNIPLTFHPSVINLCSILYHFTTALWSSHTILFHSIPIFSSPFPTPWLSSTEWRRNLFMMRAGRLSGSTITRFYCNPIKIKENGLWIIYSALCTVQQALHISPGLYACACFSLCVCWKCLGLAF